MFNATLIDKNNHSLNGSWIDGKGIGVRGTRIKKIIVYLS